MATPQATPDSQSEESNSLELPSACDIRDYVLREPCQEAHSEAASSAEGLSILSSSEVDPGLLSELCPGPLIYSVLEKEARDDKASQAVPESLTCCPRSGADLEPHGRFQQIAQGEPAGKAAPLQPHKIGSQFFFG
ncbi:PREDICTED: uncharacterized protein C20orf196 homolog isoform X2 [Myotis brandtii]|uniref:uncharacterized protein C20orf196 homolog isoform X2 n=1 Tax=Myotis brandtii TaxID=109478 RepID=UPI0007042A62|nr:PREDICTED: uncharacterized protein C20orf196 homolog isoform X2 [Myotis brandtii]